MFHVLLQVLWGLTAQKGYANRFSGLSDPRCQEQTSGYYTLVLLINPNWSECHSNTSIVLLHASDFYSIKMEVYNRGIISIKWPWRWDCIKHFSLFCLPGSQEANVSGSKAGTWFLFQVVSKEGRTATLYFEWILLSKTGFLIENQQHQIGMSFNVLKQVIKKPHNPRCFTTDTLCGCQFIQHNSLWKSCHKLSKCDNKS